MPRLAQLVEHLAVVGNSKRLSRHQGVPSSSLGAGTTFVGQIDLVYTLIVKTDIPNTLLMAEVRYQIGVHRQIIYKAGKESKGKYYLTKYEENMNIWPIFLLIAFCLWSIFSAIIDNLGLGELYLFCFGMPVAWLLGFSPIYYYKYKHNECIERIDVTPRYAYGNTNSRGWWKK